MVEVHVYIRIDWRHLAALVGLLAARCYIADHLTPDRSEP